MTPQEALTMMDNALAQLTVDRNTHARLQQAAQIIREALKPKEKKDGKE